jgi:hypothetical protein
MSYSYESNNQVQPHSELNFHELVELENSLESFTRKSWDVKIPVVFKKGKTDYAIIDEERNRVIYFIHGVSQDVHRFNSSFQILHHWLCSVKYGEVANTSIRVKNIRKMLELIFNGTPQDIQKYRAEIGASTGDQPNLGWNVLHYPLTKGVSGLEEYFAGNYEGLEKYSSFEAWVCYGIVSQSSHKRTDKEEVLQIAKNFFEERGFVVDEPYWAKDYRRNYEPIVLFKGVNYYKESNFSTLVGINFGLDNGISGYRVGLGLAMDDGQIAWLHPHTIKNHPDWVKHGTMIQDIRWIHHKSHGSMEKTLTEFLSKTYNKMFDSYVDIMELSKHNHFPNQQVSQRQLEATYRREFEPHHDHLVSLHDEFVKKYDSTVYAHFKTWLGLAGQLDKTSGLAASRARWIAECILTRI